MKLTLLCVRLPIFQIFIYTFAMVNMNFISWLPEISCHSFVYLISFLSIKNKNSCHPFFAFYSSHFCLIIIIIEQSNEITKLISVCINLATIRFLKNE